MTTALAGQEDFAKPIGGRAWHDAVPTQPSNPAPFQPALQSAIGEIPAHGDEPLSFAASAWPVLSDTSSLV